MSNHCQVYRFASIGYRFVRCDLLKDGFEISCGVSLLVQAQVSETLGKGEIRGGFTLLNSSGNAWVNTVSGPGGAGNETRDIHETYFVGREGSEKSTVARTVRACSISSKLD